jgi:hopanoid biosynthesis associated RND transporter like protein HpnN
VTLPPDEGFQEAGAYLLVSFTPERDYAELDPIEGPLRAAREAVTATLARHPGVEAGVTGRAALSADEMARTSWDMTWGALLGALGVTLVFSFVFRELLRPALAVASLGLAIGWTFGLATLTVGSLNLLSSVFAIVLVGIGVDFGIHVLARYRARLASDAAPDAAARDAILHAGRGNLTSAATTVVAFAATGLTDFAGLAELGFVAGSGVLLCLVSMQLVFPAALLLVDRRRAPSAPPPLPVPGPLERLSARPARVWLLLIAATAAGLVGLRGVHFDFNLLELQAQDLESVRWERRLLAQSDVSSWTTVALTDSLEEAGRLHQAFLGLGAPVARVESAASLSLHEPPDRRPRLVAVAERAGLPPREAAAPADADALARSLEALAEAAADLAELALGQGAAEAEAVDGLLALEERALSLVEALPPLADLEARQGTLLTQLRAELRQLDRLLRPGPWSAEDVPKPLRRHLVSPAGRFAVHVFPREDVWDPAAMDRFLSAVRLVDPEVTGASVSVHESSKVMLDAFRTVLWVTCALIPLLLLLEYRSRLALIGLAPLALGCLWFLELMGGLGVSLNMANFFAVPVLIGVGIDDVVHVLNHRVHHPSGPRIAHPTGTSVILSTLTTMVGFGALGLGSHAGLASFGHLMALGALALLAASVVLLPLLLRHVGPAS